MSAKTYEYAAVIAQSGQNLGSSKPAAEVEIKLVKGLQRAELPGSLATTFVVEGRIVKGQVPQSAGVKRIRIRFTHGWIDPFLVGRQVLTLQFAPNGELLAIKEIPKSPASFETK